MDNKIEEFILELRKNGIKMEDSKLISILNEVKQIMKSNKDKTKEEMVDDITTKYVEEIAYILDDRNLIPGYSVGVKENNNKIIIENGTLSYNDNHNINQNTMFDIASCSKLFTQIIAYNLISENVFNFDSKVVDLDPRFKKLGDLTIGDITSFNVEFRTPGRIENVENKDEALKILFDTEVIYKEKYNYNDIGMIILKEVLEAATNKTYEELFNQYIVNKLNLKNTFVNVPKNRYSDLTATPNREQGLVNDPKAIILGGFSGHAGVFSSSADLLEVGEAVINGNLIPKDMLKDVYTSGINDDRRGIMGNTFVYHEQGLDKSFVSNNEPIQSFRVQGSTRNVFGASKYILKDNTYVSSNAILLNPSSMNLEYAKELETKINERALANWIKKDPINNSKLNYKEQVLVRNFSINNNLFKFKLIDPRNMATIAKTSDPITELIAEMQIKLIFLDNILKSYGMQDEDVNIRR